MWGQRPPGLSAAPHGSVGSCSLGRAPPPRSPCHPSPPGSQERGTGHGSGRAPGARPAEATAPALPRELVAVRTPRPLQDHCHAKSGATVGTGGGGATGAKRSLPPHLQPRPHRPRPPGPLYLPEHPAWGPRGRGRAEGHSRTPKAAEGGLRGTSQDPWVSPNPRGCRAAPPGPVRAAAAPPTQESRLGWTRSGIQKPSF